METKKIYEIFLKYPKIITDSRKTEKNSIFWALKGENFDGNTFIKNALNAGAEYAVSDNPKYKINDKVLLIEDTLEALQKLAKYHKNQLNLPVFMLTGTNGKTTTKELLNKVLQKKYNVKATKGNLNNHIGVPLTLLSFDKNTEIGIVEAGANHKGEIETLSDIADPDFGLITNIGKAHLEGFGSFEGVIKAKSELYEYLVQKNGTIFYNADNEILSKLNKGKNTISYGTKKTAYIRGEIISNYPFLSVKIFTADGKNIEINSQLTGEYNFENILAASCVGTYFKIPLEDIKNAVESYKPSNNRSQILDTGYNTVILDAYNANPSSMKASLENFLSYKKDKKIIILGDMYELGKYSKEEHEKILDFLVLNKNKHPEIKEIIVCGKFFGESFNKKHKNKIIYFEKTQDVKSYVKEKKYKNHTFLIKGSRAVKMEDLTESIL